MKEVELSIIIPCYNAEKTVRQAVESCYFQGIERFEIIIVDDSSTDGSIDVIRQLEKEYANIAVYTHKQNKGGGAARNTAIRHSSGACIFPLDADDVLPKNVLSKMLVFLKTYNLDGVLFQDRHFFQKSIRFPHNIHKNSMVDRTVEFHDLFSDNNFLFNNFLYTRKAFDSTKGYPEHHGFDTQSFEIRFLVSKNKAQVCPDTLYYHRQTTKHSYFDREQYAGCFSKNMYFVFEDMIFLFSKKVRAHIANYDIFNKNKVGGENIYQSLRDLYKENSDDFFIEGYNEKMGKDAFVKYTKDTLSSSTEPSNLFCNGVYQLNHGDPHIALDHFGRLLTVRYGQQLIWFNMLRAVCMLQERDVVKREKEVSRMVESFIQTRQPKRFYRTAVLQLVMLSAASKIFLKKNNMYVLVQKIFKKMKREFFSFLISFRINKTSKTDFLEEYAQIKDVYNTFPTILSEFVEPKWLSYMEQMESLFREKLPYGFLRHSLLKSTMSVFGDEKWRRTQTDVVEKYCIQTKCKDALREDSIGNPILSNWGLKTSANTIHLFYHLLKFQKETNVNFTQMSTVVEFGGGYGGMAKLYKRINANSTYVIVDLPIFSALQAVYLRTIFGKEHIQIITGKHQKIEKGKIVIIPFHPDVLECIHASVQPDLFISTWALSESSEKTKQYVVEREFFGAASVLLAYQKNNNDFQTAESVTHLSQNMSIIYNEETEYLENNFYLFAKRV